jgi:hypothetical protein
VIKVDAGGHQHLMKPDATDGRPHGHWIWVNARNVAAAAAVALAGMLLGPGSARADTVDVEAIHFRYSAPPECPAEGELVAAAVEMGGAFRSASPGELARGLDVVVEKTDRGFSGSLAVRSLSGEERVRTVTCARCESVVRALGLFVALALVDPAVAPAVKPPPETEPILPEPLRPEETEQPDRSGGIAVMALWGSFRTDPDGAGVMAVASVGATRLGALVATAREEVDSQYVGSSPTPALVTGHGQTGRLGAVAAWGAPWSRDAWVGLVTEAGLRGGVLHGTTSPTSSSGSSCSCCNEDGTAICTSGPGTPTTWRSLTPYVAGTFAVHLLPPRLPVRPFVGLTLTWSGDYRGASAASVLFDAGLAWRSW